MGMNKQMLSFQIVCYLELFDRCHINIHFCDMFWCHVRKNHRCSTFQANHTYCIIIIDDAVHHTREAEAAIKCLRNFFVFYHLQKFWQDMKDSLILEIRSCLIRKFKLEYRNKFILEAILREFLMFNKLCNH